MKGRGFGDYDLISRIGSDGAFFVYRARHRQLNRMVILKILADRRQSFDAEGACRRELEAADRLDHPAILRVYETGVVGGRPFLAHAYVDGERLFERLARGTIPPRIAWDWTRQLAEALLFAHDRNSLHGSLRPEVVWLSQQGEVRLGGFGNPILFENLALDSSASWAGYLAPEQAGGRGVVGRLTDVYGLGALLYAMVTGGPPFRGTTLAETCRLIRNHPLIYPSRLHPGLSENVDRICSMCLRKEPSRRFFNEHRPLEKLLSELRSLRPSNTAPPKTWQRWLRRHVSMVRAAVLIILFALLPLSVDQIQHRRHWETLMNPRASLREFEQTAHYFSRRAVDQPRSHELHAASELSRVRLGRVNVPKVMTWQKPANQWQAVVNLAYVLALASQGQTQAARNMLEQAQFEGYTPQSDFEQRLWQESLALTAAPQ